MQRLRNLEQPDMTDAWIDQTQRHIKDRGDAGIVRLAQDQLVCWPRMERLRR